MTTAVATVIDKKRAEIYKAMTPDTRAISEQMLTKLTTVESGRVLGAYNIGALLQPIKKDQRAYGADAVQQLADYHNIPGGADSLYKLMTLAERFDKDFIMAETRKPMANGSYMTVQHWVTLTRLSDPVKIEKMLKRILVESMSASDVEVEIRSGVAGTTTNSRSGGRKPNVPSNPVVGLQRTIEIATKFTRWDTEATKSLCDTIDTMPPDSVTPALLAKLEAAMTSITKANEASATMSKSLQHNLKRVKSVLANRPATEETAAEETPKKAAAGIKPVPVRPVSPKTAKAKEKAKAKAKAEAEAKAKNKGKKKEATSAA